MISISTYFFIVVLFSGIATMFAIVKLVVWFGIKKEQLNCNHDIFSREVSDGFGKLSTIIYCKKCGMSKKIKH